MTSLRLLIIVSLILAGGASLSASSGANDAGARGAGRFLRGDLLVANRDMPDPRFRDTVIYMVEHDANGAFGLIVNRAYAAGPAAAILKDLGIEAEKSDLEIRLFYGGPVEPGRGYVLHTDDWAGEATLAAGEGFAVTLDVGVLKAVMAGGGPRRSLLALGYAGWGPGQLEAELRREDWLTAPASLDMVFAVDPEKTWVRALKVAGIAL